MVSLTLNSRLVYIEQVPDIVQCVLIYRAVDLFALATHIHQTSAVELFKVV